MPGRFRFLAVALAALVFGVSAMAAAQPLGDVARKEQQRRKTVAGSGKTYTNQDLGPGGTRQPSPPAPAPASSSQVAGPGAAADPAKPDVASASAEAAEKDPKQTEEYWRERMEALKSELQRNEMFVEALQSRLNALATDFVNRDDPAQRAVLANDRLKALAEMERTKNLVVKLKAQIAEVEEEARQAGVPPGWVR
jgi:hypothetical protein